MTESDSLAKIAPTLRREALAEQIVRQIVGLIKDGNLKPGDRLPAERTLATQVGVGRPTLREALRALQLLGIVDIRHGGGVFVSEIQPEALMGPLHLFISADNQDLKKLLEARKVIEGAVLAFVASKISDAAIDALNSNLRRLKALIGGASDDHAYRQQFHDLAQEFRDIIQTSADNPVLSRAVLSFDVYTATARNQLLRIDSPERLLDNHSRIVEALTERNPAAAKEALEAHIDYLSSTADAATEPDNA